jgi:nucleoside-diphosphate-sugar epimerase
VQRLGAEAVPGDLADRRALTKAASGCALAFHAAAHLGEQGPREDFVRDNFQGTRNVLDACASTGVARLVHVSTEAVLLAGEPLVEVDESAPRRPDSPAPYSATKAMAEDVVLSHRHAGLEAVIVRPRFVWGAGDRTLLPALVQMARSGRLVWVAGGTNVTDVTHVDNVVEGLVLAAERGRPGGIYFITDGRRAQFREFVSELLETQGVTPPTRSIPRPVAAALVVLGETAWRVLPLPGAPPLSRFAYWVSSHECTLDISRARGELGYEPVVTRERGMAGLRAAAAAAAGAGPAAQPAVA